MQKTTFSTKKLLLAMLPLAAVFLSFQGSGNWNLAKDKKGVKIYTRIAEGSPLKEFKGVMTVDASLSSLAAVLNDLDNYPNWIYKCEIAYMIDETSPTENHYYTEVSAPMVANRDAIAHLTIEQNPETGTVTYNMTAVPDYAPKKEGNVRIERMYGFWELTPLGDGNTQVTYQVFADPGGSIPNWLINSFVTDSPYNTMLQLRETVKQPKYQNASFDYIKE